MKFKIRFLKDYEVNGDLIKKGKTLDVSRSIKDNLVGEGIAEEVTGK